MTPNGILKLNGWLYIALIFYWIIFIYVQNLGKIPGKSAKYHTLPTQFFVLHFLSCELPVACSPSRRFLLQPSLLVDLFVFDLLAYCILTWWFSRYICVVINVKNAPAFFSSPFSTTILTRDTSLSCEMHVHLSIKYCWCLVDIQHSTRSMESFTFPTEGDLIFIHL